MRQRVIMLPACQWPNTPRQQNQSHATHCHRLVPTPYVQAISWGIFDDAEWLNHQHQITAVRCRLFHPRAHPNRNHHFCFSTVSTNRKGCFRRDNHRFIGEALNVPYPLQTVVVQKKSKGNKCSTTVSGKQQTVRLVYLALKSYYRFFVRFSFGYKALDYTVLPPLSTIWFMFIL